MTDRGSPGINASHYDKLPLDPIKGFELIGIAAEGHVVVVAGPGTGIKSIADLIAMDACGTRRTS